MFYSPPYSPRSSILHNIFLVLTPGSDLLLYKLSSLYKYLEVSVFDIHLQKGIGKYSNCIKDSVCSISFKC